MIRASNLAGVAEAALVSAQLGRPPRSPWRVAARCTWGFPAVITSPSRLDDGTPFPTWAWLTCPWLAESVSAEESRGAAAEWAARAAGDPSLAARLGASDAEVRRLRAAESGGRDECEALGAGGQRDPLGVKCLHVHVALRLAGIDDPIGEELLGEIEPACPDERCAQLARDSTIAAQAAQASEEGP